MAEVICYGSIAVDELLWLPRWPAPGDDIRSRDEATYLGGPALNVALPLAAWGRQVAIGGNQLGDDARGRLILARLAETSIDTSAVVLEAGRRTALCTLLITPEGERTIIGRGFGDAAAGPLPALDGARCLSLDSYGPGRPTAARRARSAGLLVVAGDLTSLADPLVPLADVVVLSADVLKTADAAGDPQIYAARLQQAGPRIVTLSDGPRPALLMSAGRTWYAQPPQIAIRETTGAGDSFRAGLIHGLLGGRSHEQALALAVAAGSLRCARVGGAENPPALEELERAAAAIQVWC